MLLLPAVPLHQARCVWSLFEFMPRANGRGPFKNDMPTRDPRTRIRGRVAYLKQTSNKTRMGVCLCRAKGGNTS